jgi:ubiquinone/menaquinone biosynthesis C-methylase UbiE
VDRARRGHYHQIAAHFDADWSYSEPYLNWMTEGLRSDLRLRSGSTVLDVGSGTGLYARRLVEGTPAAARVICLDPSPAMLQQVPNDPRLIPVIGTASAAGAVLQTLGLDAVDHVLAKGVVHHFADIATELTRLTRVLSPAGTILVAVLPPTLPHPLFSQALHRFEQEQPHSNAIVRLLEEAGLATFVRTSSFRLQVPLERYLDMVRNRYMSLLSAFTDDEIEVGIEEIRQTHGDTTPLEIEERFVYITGVVC